jgi:hypothetical protein
MSTNSEPAPAILDLDRALENFRDKVAPLLEPSQEENWDGVKVKDKELAILRSVLQLAGHCMAILIYRLCMSERVKVAAEMRAFGKAGLNYTREGFRDVTVTLIGNVQVKVRTAYKLARNRKKRAGRKRKRGKRGKSKGQGFYPVLRLLGIDKGLSPLVRCRVSQAATQLPSFEKAKQIVGWLGLDFDAKRIRRISERFCQIGLAVREARLIRLAQGTLPVGEALKGKRVVIAVDGGRMKIRCTYRRGRKRKSGWPGYDSNWREPKLLTIYVLDEEGRKMTGPDIPLINDGTLGKVDKFLEILHLCLHELGIAEAEVIVLTGDGAPWIWKNIPSLLLELGCRPEQIVQVLDRPHAVEHISQLAEALFGEADKAKSWAKKWAKKLKKGQSQALIAEIQRQLTGEKVHDLDEAQREYGYFHRHHVNGRLDYPRFKAQKLPCGSGVVESLIRQVVNLRLKSNGMHWLHENGEAFLHARCQWAAHQWSDFCNGILTFGLSSPG